MVLQLGTLRAAAAVLGREQAMGSLEPGKIANMAVVALPEPVAADPYELLFDSDLPIVWKHLLIAGSGNILGQ